jgi:hypothetical protein
MRTAPALMASMMDPRQPVPLPVPDATTDSAVFDYSTWDVAVATQSLAYIDPEVVAMISDAQRMQQMIEDDHKALRKCRIRIRTLCTSCGVGRYFGDTALHERLLLERYDKLLPRLDKGHRGRRVD